MKFIHCADLHLGSKISSKFPKEISEERRAEVRNSFRRMVGYANENAIDVIVLAGDVFDSEKPFKKDRLDNCFNYCYCRNRRYRYFSFCFNRF